MIPDAVLYRITGRMAENKQLADLVAASLAALDRLHGAARTLSAERARPAAPGDVYAFPATQGVEWAVLLRDAGDRRRILLVPGDGNAMTGNDDLELTDGSAAAPLVLRCRFATWVDEAILEPQLRSGVLSGVDIVRARQKWLDVGDGKAADSPLAREVDDDPEYEDWLRDTVEPARRALEAKNSSSS